MMKDIRNTNEKSNSRAIISSRVSMERQEKDKWNNRADMHLMLGQIQELKRDVKTIKEYN